MGKAHLGGGGAGETKGETVGKGNDASAIGRQQRESAQRLDALGFSQDLVQSIVQGLRVCNGIVL